MSVLWDCRTAFVELSSTILNSMRSDELEQFSEWTKLGDSGYPTSETIQEWSRVLVNGASEQENAQQPQDIVPPSMDLRYPLIPRDCDVILTDEHTLHHLAFCGNLQGLKEQITHMNNKSQTLNKTLTTDKTLKSTLIGVLESAVKGSQYQIVEWLLNEKAVSFDSNAFRLATMHYSPVVMELLLNRAPTSPQVDNESLSPLHFAAKYGNVAATEFLIARDKEWMMFGKKCTIRRSPLELAVLQGFPEIVRLLIEHIRSSQDAMKLFHGALCVAILAYDTKDGDEDVRSNRKAILDVFIESRLDFLIRPDPDVLDAAVETGNTAILEWALEGQSTKEVPWLKKQLERCLCSSASFGHDRVTKRLLKFGISPNVKSSANVSALTLACIAGHAEVVSLLANEEADHLVRYRNLTPFEWTVKRGHFGAMQSLLAWKKNLDDLLAHDGDVSKAHCSIIHYAVASRNAQVVARILELGISPEATNSNGETAIHAAIRRCDVEIVQVLLQHNADTNVRNAKFGTPIEIAAKKGSFIICQHLLDAGAVVDVSQKALENAASSRRSSAELMELLWQHRRSSDGFEAIKASLRQQVSSDSTKWLIQNTDLSPKTSWDQRSLETIASRYDCTVLETILETNEQIEVGPGVVAAAVKNGVDGERVLSYLLTKHRVHTKSLLSPEILQSAVSNQVFGKEVTRMLLAQHAIDISDLTLDEAVQNSQWGPELVGLLFQSSRDPIRVTSRLIRSIMGNWQLGERVFEIFMDPASAKKQIEFEAKVEMIRLMDYDELQPFLEAHFSLDSFGSSELHRLISAAVRNVKAASQLVEYFETRSKVVMRDVPMILQEIVENHEHAKTFVLAMIKADALSSEDIHLILGRTSSNTARIVLEEAGDRLKMGRTTLRTVLMNPMYQPELLEALMRHPDFDEKLFDEQTLLMAVNDRHNCVETVRQIQECFPQIQWPSVVLKAATHNEQLVQLLQDQFRSDPEPKHFVSAALRNWRSADILIDELSKWDNLKASIEFEDGSALAAMRQMDAVTMAKILGSESMPSLKLLEAAASNWDHGVNTLGLLLNEPYSVLAEGDSVPKSVVRAAAANWKCGYKMLKLLRERYKKKLIVTTSVLQAAAGNPRDGLKMMRLLLDVGDNSDVTPLVVATAAANIGCGATLVRELLSRIGARAKNLITHDVLAAAAGNGCCGLAVLKQLMKHDGVKLDKSVLAYAAANVTSGTMCMAVGRQRGKDQPITAASLQSPKKNRVTLIEPTFLAGVGGAVFRTDAKPFETGRERREDLNLLVRWTRTNGRDVDNEARLHIEYEWKWDDGSAVVGFILDKDPTLADALYAKPAARGSNLNIVQQWLRRGVVPTSGMLQEAVQNTTYGYQIAVALLRANVYLPISTDLLSAAARNASHGDAILPLLLRHDLSLRVPKAIVAKGARGHIALEMLLARLDRPDEEEEEKEFECKWPDIKDSAMDAVRRNDGLEMADWILKRFGTEAASDVLSAAAGSLSPTAPDICQLVCQRSDILAVGIPEAALVSAAANPAHSERMVRLLVSYAYQSQSPLDLYSILIAAARNERDGLATMQWLLRHDCQPSISVPFVENKIFDALRTAAVNPSYGVMMISLLLSSFPQLNADDVADSIVMSFLQAAATNGCCSDMALDVLLRHFRPSAISTIVIEAAVSNASCSPAMVDRLCRSHRHTDSEFKFSDAVWVAACGNVQHGLRLLRDILQAPPRVSSDMVRAASANPGCGIAVLQCLYEWHAEGKNSQDMCFVTRELIKVVRPVNAVIFDATIRKVARKTQCGPLLLSMTMLQCLESDSVRELIDSGQQLYVAELPASYSGHIPLSILRQLVDASHTSVYIHPTFFEWLTSCGDAEVAEKASSLLSQVVKDGNYVPVTSSDDHEENDLNLSIYHIRPPIRESESQKEFLSFFDNESTPIPLESLRSFLDCHQIEAIPSAFLELATKDVECLRLLLDRCTKSIITIDLIVQTFDNIPALQTLLQHPSRPKITAHILKKAANKLETLKTLIETESTRVPPISEAVLEAAADNNSTFPYLVGHVNNLQATEAILLAAASNPASTKILLEKDEEAEITERVLERATENIGVMKLLLEQRPDQQIRVTDKVFRAAAAESLSVTRLLAEIDPGFPVDRLLEKANSEVTRWLLERPQKIAVTDSTWRSAFRNVVKMKALLKYDPKFDMDRFLRCFSGALFPSFPLPSVFREIVRQPNFRIESYHVLSMPRILRDCWATSRMSEVLEELLTLRSDFVTEDFLLQAVTSGFDLTTLAKVLQKSYHDQIHVSRRVQNVAQALSSQNGAAISSTSPMSIFRYSSIFILDGELPTSPASPTPPGSPGSSTSSAPPMSPVSEINKDTGLLPDVSKLSAAEALQRSNEQSSLPPPELEHESNHTVDGSQHSGSGLSKMNEITESCTARCDSGTWMSD